MSDINVNFTINQLNANLSIDPAPNVTLNIADTMVANFFIEGTTGGSGTVTQVGGNGSGLGFSLGGTVTSIGNITLTTPTDTALRTTLNIGNVANINLNGNGSQVLAGNGSWITSATGTGTVTTVNTSGSGLGFSLSGGPITTSGTVTLTIPSDTALRTSLNIGNVANINLNGNGQTFLNGGGSFSAPTVSEIANFKYALEAVTTHTHTTGTYNYDVINSAVSYSTANAVANITINFRGNSTNTLASLVSAGKSVTAVYLMTTGATGYIPSTIQIDGSTQTVRYAGNISPLLIANTICSYTYTMVKTVDSPATWLVLGSQTRYG